MRYEDVLNKLRVMSALNNNSVTDVEEVATAVHKLVQSVEEQAYIKGMHMARRLLRLRMGLGTPEDEVVLNHPSLVHKMEGDKNVN